ncbi:MAG TPA: IS481 family transposase [Miltoncostaeaceae bacterium]|nr:IS481 family transposase [Miltoncostaeaceae bacterium]
MRLHANAALGLAGRRKLVGLIEQGHSLRAAAAALGVSPATAHRWWHRWARAGAPLRTSGACLADRSSAPHRQPRRLSDAQEAPILAARQATNLGPGRLAHICRRARSTIYKVLARHGLSRRRSGPRPVCRRYEWSRPGALIHIDTARLARFWRPGHRSRGRVAVGNANVGAGHLYLHVAVDDNSRYAYVEQHPDERAPTCAAFLERALAHFDELGMGPAEAVMTDGARNYRTAAVFQEALARAGARHILTPPYTPRWNGKAERFIQTLKAEWAYAREWPSSLARARALSSWLRTYNRRRLHSSLGDRPPISRVHNVRG